MMLRMDVYVPMDSSSKELYAEMQRDQFVILFRRQSGMELTVCVSRVIQLLISNVCVLDFK